MRALPRTLRDKTHFSGHETFPLRQLWLKKAYDAVKRQPEAHSAVFSAESSIARFGVGKNMVASIRHWALACSIIEETDGKYTASDLGEQLFGERGLDPYLEHPATSWLMHWMLAARGRRSTTWFWIFNMVNGGSFTRSAVKEDLKAIALGGPRKRALAASTLDNDINCCLRCYLPAGADDTAEEVVEPLLAELGLLASAGREVIEFRRGPKRTLPDGVFAFALADFWTRWNAANEASQTTLSFDAIAHDYGSPGRVFKLDEGSVAERVARLGEATRGAFEWADSAGIRQVVRTDRALSAPYMERYLRTAYE